MTENFRNQKFGSGTERRAQMSYTDARFAPVLPFDGRGFDNFKIYTPTSYTRDLTIAEDDNPLKMHNPNMIKYFRCETAEPIKLGGD